MESTFTEQLLTGDAKVSFNQAALDIDLHDVDIFNEVQLKMIK